MFVGKTIRLIFQTRSDFGNTRSGFIGTMSDFVQVTSGFVQIMSDMVFIMSGNVFPRHCCREVWLPRFLCETGRSFLPGNCGVFVVLLPCVFWGGKVHCVGLFLREIDDVPVGVCFKIYCP